MWSTISSTPAEPKMRNSKLSMEQELKLPKVGYIVKNFKAPIMMTINRNIKRKVQKSKYNLTEQNENQNNIEYSNDECNTSSDSDIVDSELEDIITHSPAFKIALRRDQTIHKRAEMTFKLNNHKISDDYEDETIKKQLEIIEAKKEIDEVKFNNKKTKYSILNDLYKEESNKLKKNNKKYRDLKEPISQVKVKRMMSTNDSYIFSRLSVLNNNPILTFNGISSYPHVLRDTAIMSGVYNVNLYKQKSMNENKHKRS
jgi:hypothetical protein